MTEVEHDADPGGDDFGTDEARSSGISDDADPDGLPVLLRPPAFRPPRRTPGPGPYLRALRRTPEREWWSSKGFPFDVPALEQLDGLSFDAPVTLLAGDNGTGKSTIVELIADAMAFAPEGGELVRSGALPPKPREVLTDRMRPDLSATQPAGGYFLRAESFFNIAEFIDGNSVFAPDIALYGGVPLHGQSHGQSFLALAANRFGPRGFYLLDEPEAALSLSGCLALVAIIARAARAGAQFIIATHSPVLLACPGAVIYELDEGGITPCPWDALDVVRNTRAFLDAPERFIEAALLDLD